MKVRLTRKFADFIDGIDLSSGKPGDVIELTRREAQILMAEGWAVRIDGDGVVAQPSADAAVVRPSRSVRNNRSENK